MTDEQNTIEEELQEPNPQEEPIIPPMIFLIIAGLGVFAALAVLFTQPSFGVIGWGALGISAISIVAWALMNPQHFMDFITGRGVAFGGPAVLVTLVLIVAMVVLYSLIAAQSWRFDFTERDTFSLNDDVRDILVAIANDPTTPSMHIIGFYTPQQASQRDRIEVLLNDFVRNSNNKISYEFVDPNRNPALVQQLAGEGQTISGGQFYVIPIDPETGEQNRDLAEFVAFGDQFQLANAIITVSASGAGEFIAYFLDVPGAVDMAGTADDAGGDFITSIERVGWTTEIVTPLEMIGDSPRIDLSATAADGVVLVIPGGSEPLPADFLPVLEAFIDEGGDVVLLGDLNFEGGAPLIVDEALNAILAEDFGVSVRDDVVFDPDNSIQNAFNLYLPNFGTHPITDGQEDAGALMLLPHSIEIAETSPENVIVTPLITTGENAYAKSDIDLSADLTDENIARADGDLGGPLTVAVAAENTANGARLVIFGNDTLIVNGARGFTDVANPDLMRQSLNWVTEFENFADAISRITPEVDENIDAPVFVTDSDRSFMGFVAIVLLPFGVLGVGIFQWWLRRERR